MRLRSAVFSQLLADLADEYDQTPGRNEVSALTHSLQTADRAINAGADDELILCALVHDAFRIVAPTHHGEALALALADRLTYRRQALLRTHSEWQYDAIHGSDIARCHAAQPWYAEACTFAEWDAASFDPAYPTPTLDALAPRLRVLD